MMNWIVKNAELHWISKEGYNCYIVKLQNSVSCHRCGYVEVPKENITREIDDYDDVPVNVHGGLTYGNNGIWGFDCAHYDDTIDYWTLERVKEETNKLSEELSKITWKEIIEYKLLYMPKWFKERIIIK